MALLTALCGRQWIRNADVMVMAWLLNSSSKDRNGQFLYLPSSQALWKQLEERFAVSSAPQLYQIQREMVTTEQGNDFVTCYYGKIKKCWDEKERLMPMPVCDCGNCNCMFHKSVLMDSTNKLFQFLMGLNETFDSLRSQILALLPTVNIRLMLWW